MTGMQVARLKAESQGRKAKVKPSPEWVLLRATGLIDAVESGELTLCVTACQFIP